MSTPHIAAEKNEVAKIVLMPGDPLRAKFIAETYLEDVVCFNEIRNMFGYTGTYKGTRLSVMGSGMGMPSIGIYSFELFNFYDVECIIRIGSAGAYTDKLELFDLFLAEDAWSESSFAKAQAGDEYDVIKGDEIVNAVIKETAKKLDQTLKVGRTHSSDVFYHENNVKDHSDFYKENGCQCVEMESFALFHNANILGKKAACLLTISDSLVTKQATTASERQTSFNKMMELALESALSLVEEL